MVKYKYEDVIINPKDPRVKIGDEYYFTDSPNCAIRFLNQGREVEHGYLARVDITEVFPFVDRTNYRWACIIRVKEPWNKYAPFDLSKEEDRGQLKGRWIRKKDNSEIKLIWWLWELDGKWMIDEDINPQQLLNDWVFEDGSPCGVAVEDKE